jgi:hypothetical protein
MKEIIFADKSTQDKFSQSDINNLARKAVELKQKLNIDLIITDKGLSHRSAA